MYTKLVLKHSCVGLKASCESLKARKGGGAKKGEEEYYDIIITSIWDKFPERERNTEATKIGKSLPELENFGLVEPRLTASLKLEQHLHGLLHEGKRLSVLSAFSCTSPPSFVSSVSTCLI